jgi:hypothetical protein
VRSNGEFEVTASGTDPQISTGGNISIDFSGSTNGVMQAAISTSQTGTIVTETQACTVSVVSPQDPGSLWISYVCPLLTTQSSPAVGCHAQGQLVLAGCGT